MGISSKFRKGLKSGQLPPTEEAAMQHALRVYLQIQYWKALSSTEIDLQLWLWKKENEFFEPIMTYDPQNKLFP